MRAPVLKPAVKPTLSAVTKPVKQPATQVNSTYHDNMISFDSQPIPTEVPPANVKAMGTTTE